MVDQAQSFGVSQITVKEITDSANPIWGMAKVIGDIIPETTQELIENVGGASSFATNAAPGQSTGEITLMVKEYSANVLKLLNPSIDGSVVENTSGDAAGFVSATLTEIVGTSMADAVGGIIGMAVDATTVTDLAYGDYKIVATAAGTFDIYLDTDISHKTSYVDDNLKINNAAITNPGTDGTVVYQGIEFTAGTGPSAFEVGDVATFSVRPVNSWNMTSYIGKEGACGKKFELVIVAENTCGQLRKVTVPRCVCGGGAGLTFVRKDYSTFEVTIKILQDSSLGYAVKEEFINR